MINAGLIGGGGPASSGAAGILQVDTAPNLITITDAATHLLHTINLSLTQQMTLFIHYSLMLKSSNATSGLHLIFQLDGSNIGPFDPGGFYGDVLMSGQTTEFQDFSVSFFQTIAAGNHAVTLSVSAALVVATYSIRYSQLAVKS